MMPFARSAFSAAFLILLSCFVCAHAQSVLPSGDELDMLKSLSSEQRDAIMEQLGLGRGSSSMSGTTDRSTSDSRARAGSSRLRRQMQRGSGDDSGEESDVPVLKGDDSIIVELAIHRPVPDTPPGQAGAQQGQSPQTPAVQNPNAVLGLGTNNLAQQQIPTPRDAEVDLLPQEREKLQQLIDLIRAKNPYRLSRDGVLSLPGFAGIPLAGLNEIQATLRLQNEPAFRKLDLKLTRLPLQKLGPDGLKPFGAELFGDQATPSTYAPLNDVPVPSEYTVGPGDELTVQLYGNQNKILHLTVSGDGRVSFPELGPINVSGQRFTEVRRTLEAQVAKQMIGVKASVSMGETRSIQVFVVGDVRYPGTYTISGLATVTSALFAAGGIRPIGSLRNVQLKRQGRLIRKLDLYDLLLRGDTSDDARLLSGDVIFVPAVGSTISVFGEVRRPAIYEVEPQTSIADIVQLAGGLTSEADPSKSSLTTVDANRRRLVTQVDLDAGAGLTQRARNGDSLRVARLKPTVDSGITIEGHVYTPGAVSYREGMRLTDAVHSVDELQPNADIHYLLIRRELPPDRRIAALSADLSAALKAPGSQADIVLMPRDRIIVFDQEPGRERIVRPLMDELRLQSTAANPTDIVRIDGRAKAPGEYPLEVGMRVRDLIRAGGGLTDAAYIGKAELTRYEVLNGETRQTQLIAIDLAAAQRGDPASNVELRPFDSLSVKEVSEWSGQEVVELAGEIKFPGTYSIKRGETLKSVVERAGGLTAYAFPGGSVFTRDELKRREQVELDRFAERLQNDLAMMALQGAAANQSQAGTALSVGQSLLSQIRASKAVGRLVINLPTSLKAQTNSDADVILRNGDRLVVPKFQQEVTVIGEVQNQTSHLFRSGLTREDYISLSGGVSRRADDSRVYVVRADGSVISNESRRWFRTASVEIRPGDTIVVPLNTEKLPALPFWQAVTQIIYNLAISAAAVNSFR